MELSVTNTYLVSVPYYSIYHFSVGVQRCRSGFNLHITREIWGKRFANDFDTQPVQRNDTLCFVTLSDIELCIVGLIFVVVEFIC